MTSTCTGRKSTRGGQRGIGSVSGDEDRNAGDGIDRDETEEGVRNTEGG